MKYFVRYGQDISYIAKADGIIILYKDRGAVDHYAKIYPTKEFILIANKGKLDTVDLDNWSISCPDRLIIMVFDLENAALCANKGIKFFFGIPVQSEYQLNSLKELGVSYVRLDAPLFFKMDYVKKVGIPVIAVPNVCYTDRIYRENGFHGTWIRPEDIPVYEDYIEIMFFENCNKQQEQGLFRIYSESKEWVGDLDMLFAYFNSENNNHLISSELAPIRLNCGQICETKGTCNACDNAVKLANIEVLQELKDLSETDE